MSPQAQTFEAIADFLNGITQNNYKIRRAMDTFVEQLANFERGSTIDHAAKSNAIESNAIQRTPQMTEFYQAIERYQVASILANQALVVGASLAKSIAEMPGNEIPPGPELPG